MRAKDKIEKALKDNGMQVRRIWKGYSAVTGKSGWHQTNGQDWFLGTSATEAVDMVETTAEAAML